jgi:hypothetical protein
MHVPHLADFFEVVDMAAHEKRCRSHDKVQHLARQDGHKGVLPLQRVEVNHEALSDKCQQGPVRGEEHDALLRQNARQDLGSNSALSCFQPGTGLETFVKHHPTEQEYRLYPGLYTLLKTNRYHKKWDFEAGCRDTPVIPATQEAEAEGSGIGGQPEQR